MLSSYVQTQYPILKAQNPTEGRRAIKLRLLDAFWALKVHAKDIQNLDAIEKITRADHPDPFDLPEDQEPMGILVRTDYTDEASWSNFLETFEKAEKAFLEDAATEEDDEGAESGDDGPDAMDVDRDDKDAESSSSSEDDSGPPKMFHILSNPDQLKNLSNISILRLTSDASLHVAPPTPEPIIGMPKAKPLPPHRLTSRQGLREVYAGSPNVWVYDLKSNSDGCLQSVSSQGPNLHGCATGDSWRVKATHVHELQWSMSTQGLLIDFGGLDRWDLDERNRNLKEVS